MIQRKVLYKGDVKPLSKGFGIGIKVEGIDDWINFWGFSAEEVNKKVNCKVGDTVEVEFHVKEGRHNGDVIRVVNGLDVPSQPIPTIKVPEIKTADTVDSIDTKIDKGIIEAERIFAALQPTKIYNHIKDDKQAVVELVRSVSWYL